MAKPDERMDMISEAIRNQAVEQARAITRKATAYREDEIRAYTDILINDLYASTQRAVADSKHNMLSSISQEEKKGMHLLLNRRQDLTESVFAEVRRRLTEYAATPQYRQEMMAKLAELADQYDHKNSTIHLRQTDMDLADNIKALLPGCTVLADISIHLGGFILENNAARIRIDETLEDRLQRQREWFLEHCHLRVH